MIPNEDIEIEVYTQAWTPMQMRITHRPTGKVVTGHGLSQIKLKQRLMEQLEKEIGEK